jgi:two-component system, sensor histidine kinase PdtaS
MIEADKPDSLRHRAEETLRDASLADQWRLDADMPRLVHELRVHQIELELQNEELRESRTNTERGLTLYRELYESAPIAFLSVDRAGVIVRCNHAASVAFGQIPPAGRPLKSLLCSESASAMEVLVAKVFATGGEERMDASLLRSSAEPARFYLVETAKREGADECFLALVDVTEQELSRQALDRAGKEKAALMRELQHRVKNSLNVVYGLLGIGQSQINDKASIAVIEKSRARIMAMSRIYEQLYRTDAVIDVDLRPYLEHLTGPLLDTYAIDSSRFRLVEELQSIKLDARRAALAGLIFNEFISNATKYAYRNGTSGELRVSLLERDGAIELSVSDDGPGFPEGFDYKTSGGMGFTILRMLSEQMEADLIVESGPPEGVTMTLRIKP